jgi:adenine/guanine phosphoribosyltransferase-like PRPP-binding protein
VIASSLFVAEYLTLSTRNRITERRRRMSDLKSLIREIPDYPKPGILFYDLTTLLKDPVGFHSLVDQLCEQYNGTKVDIVAGIEARGFIFAPALAYRLGAGFVPVRKPKKLPGKLPRSPTNSNTAPISSNSTKMPSSPAKPS